MCPFNVKQIISIFRQYVNETSKRDIAASKADLMEALTDFVWTDPSGGQTLQLSPLEAESIANEFYSLYVDFINNIPRSKRMQALLDRSLRAMGLGIGGINRMVQQEIDHIVLFAGTSELNARAEVLEVALMKAYQTDFNANIARETYYSTLLTSLSFLKGMFVDNVFQAVYRKISRAIIGQGSFDFDFRGSREFAKTVMADVSKGGVPINSVMQVEATGANVFGNIRASEFGATESKIKWWWDYNAWWNRVSQRTNNAWDSWGQTLANESMFFVFLKKNIERKLSRNHIDYNEDRDAVVVAITGDVIVLEFDDGSRMEYDMSPSGLRYNPLADAQNSWQFDHAIQRDDYDFDIEVAVGEVVTPGTRLATFRMLEDGLMRQVEGQGYYTTRTDATKMAKEMYEKAGLTVSDRPDSAYNRNINGDRFKRSVMEIERKGRDADSVRSAELVAMHDFFKNPMGVGAETTVERINQGAFGVLAAGQRAMGNYLSDLAFGFAKLMPFVKSKNLEQQERFMTMFRVGWQGFVNGSNAYAENLLEYSPYGLVKALLVGLSDKSMHDQAQKDFYDKRVVDLVAKPMMGMVITGLLFAVKYAIENSGMCDDAGSKPSLDDIQKGNLVICGRRIPSWVFSMPRTWVALANFVLNISETDQFGKPAIAMLGFMTSGKYNERTAGTILSEYFTTDNQYRRDNLKREAYKTIFKELVTDVLALNIPAKGLISSSALFLPAKEVEPAVEDWPRLFMWAAMQSAGIKEAVLSATSEYPVVDYFGREVLNNALKYQVGDGFKFDKYDDLISTLALDGRQLYNGRFRKLFSDQNRFFKQQPRAMTEKEFYETQLATGVLFKEWISKNYDKLMAMPVEDLKNEITGRIEYGRKSEVIAKLNELEKTSKDVAEYYAFSKERAKRADYNNRLIKMRAEMNLRKLRTNDEYYKWLIDIDFKSRDLYDSYEPVSKRLPNAPPRKKL